MNKLLNTCCVILLISLVAPCAAFSQGIRSVGPSPEEAFDKPNLYTPRDLYQMARKELEAKNIDAARLLALRIFFDNTRNPNLLNLLGVIEIQARRPLLAAEWFRKTLRLNVGDKIAHRYLSRLPAEPRAIPVDPDRIADHFVEITDILPRLLPRLSNPKLHFEAVLKALERGQFYLALALSEEYEKNHPGVDGASLTALSAWYLGRNSDAIQIVEQNLQNSPYHPILLFVKAMINDTHVGTSSSSYFKALYELDQWERALSLVDQYAKAFPSSPDAHLVQARILLDLYKTSEVGPILQEAGLRDPGNPNLDLLYVDFFLQRGENDRAYRRLNQAFRRGYNIASVNLTAGLFAIQAGRINELNVILNDARSSRPFSDIGAYSLYVSLLLMIDNTSEAAQAIEEWRTRGPERSMFAYMSAFYNFKIGNNELALDWLGKAFVMNSDRLGLLQFMIGFPALDDDPVLKAKINNKLAEAGIPGYALQQVPATTAPKTGQRGSSAQPGPANTYESDSFKLSLAAGVPPAIKDMIESELHTIYRNLATRVGTMSAPINVNFVVADSEDGTIAKYNPDSNSVLLTTHYYDTDFLRNLVIYDFKNLSENELGQLINQLPTHTLTRETCLLMIQNIIPAAKQNANQSMWLQVGLAELLAGSQVVLRSRLIAAHAAINAQASRLSSSDMLNSVFNEEYSSFAVHQTALSQSYLMVSSLIKRTGSLEKGVREIMEVIKQVSSGRPFSEVITKVYNFSEEEYEKIWRDAAFWALSQGAPYEW